MMINKKNKTAFIISTEDTEAKKVKRKKKIPKTAQGTIPFDEVYDNGVFKCGDAYVLMFKINNLDYKLERDDEQDKIYNSYQRFLNSLPQEVNYEECILNTRSDIDALRKAIVPSDKNKYPEINVDYSAIMSKVVNNSKDNVQNKSIVGVISYIPRNKLDSAGAVFKYFSEIKNNFSLLKTSAVQLSPQEAFHLLYDIYNPYNSQDFLLPNDVFRSDVNLKDYIAPSYFKFYGNRIEIGDSVSRVMFCKRFASDIEDTFIFDLLDNSYNVIVSKHIQRLDKKDSMDMLKTQMNDLEAKIEKRREVNFKRGGNYIPFSQRERERELERLQNNLTEKNNDLFELVILVMVTAKTKEDLDDLTEYIKSKARNHQVALDILGNQQEKALASVLPFGINNFATEGNDIIYHIPTDEIANFIPFSFNSYFDAGGLYYGRNLITDNPILIDRTEEMNANGFILGASGSGKSMFTKTTELIGAMFKYPDDEFIIIDPENEYRPLLPVFDGALIKLSPDSPTKINLFDTDLSFSEDGAGAVALKTDFILTFVESAKGTHLTSTEITVTDRAVRKAYADYVASGGDKAYLPTLTDFYNILKSMPEKEAGDIALIIELYVTGTFKNFSGKTNIAISKKFLLFDIFEMGDQLRTVGLQVLLELIWQRVIENKNKGVRTWLWCDEFSVMFTDSSGQETTASGAFFQKVYKRIRKHGGVATGITQNITEVLESKQAISMLNNAEFLVLLQQKKTDLDKLIKICNLSESQYNYLQTGDVGTGLIICGKKVIPFDARLEKGSKTYQLCSTKFNEKQNK